MSVSDFGKCESAVWDKGRALDSCWFEINTGWYGEHGQTRFYNVWKRCAPSASIGPWSAPLPPTSPTRSKKQMELIRTQLRKIAITGQETIHLDDRDIENLFGDKAAD